MPQHQSQSQTRNELWNRSVTRCHRSTRAGLLKAAGASIAGKPPIHPLSAVFTRSLKAIQIQQAQHSFAFCLATPLCNHHCEESSSPRRNCFTIQDFGNFGMSKNSGIRLSPHNSTASGGAIPFAMKRVNHLSCWAGETATEPGVNTYSRPLCGGTSICKLTLSVKVQGGWQMPIYVKTSPSPYSLHLLKTCVGVEWSHNAIYIWLGPIALDESLWFTNIKCPETKLFERSFHVHKASSIILTVRPRRGILISYRKLKKNRKVRSHYKIVMIYFSIFLGVAIIHPTGSSPCPYGPNEKRVAYNSCAREARRVLAWLWIEVGTHNNEKGYPPAIKHGWLDPPQSWNPASGISQLAIFDYRSKYDPNLWLVWNFDRPASALFRSRNTRSPPTDLVDGKQKNIWASLKKLVHTPKLHHL